MFTSLKQERTFEAIVTQIKEAIYGGALKHGDKLPTERDLAQTFKVSRAAIRSAMLNLEQSGFLQIKKGAGGGFFIRELDFTPVRNSLHDLVRLGRASLLHVTEARLIVEAEAAGLAAVRSTPEDTDRLEAAIESFRHRLDEGAAPDSRDLQFHVCIAEASKNPIILVMIRSLMEILFQSISSYSLDRGRSEMIVTQHREILESIRARDPEKARALMIEHVAAMRSLFKDFESSQGNRKGSAEE
jgi:DNA-binding FadR family transcriptional regulator